MFIDRTDAGKKLASLLTEYASEDCIVYGLPRGGIPVGFQISEAIRKPLEAILVKKIGVPGQEELALGAVAESDEPAFYFNNDLMLSLHLTEQDLQSSITKRLDEIRVLRERFRGKAKIQREPNATAILVDDGIATGATVKAAVMWLRSHSQKSIVVASPVCQKSVAGEIAQMVDTVVCVQSPSVLFAVGEYYSDFTQVSDEEVEYLLKAARINLSKKS